jgi:transcriptional regulator with XRE-family HTH domain
MVRAANSVYRWWPVLDSFGSALRQLRLDRGWSQEQLAARINYSKPLVGFVENGRLPTSEFAAACDRAFGTRPVLSTLCGLGEGDEDVRRRALLTGLSAAMGVGALASYTALADVMRLDLMEVAGVQEDWDTVLADYRHRLVVAPSAQFGDELLAKMMTTRQIMAERGTDSEIVRASAHLSMIYGLWMGYNGNVNTGLNYFRTANLLAERSGDADTQVWVLARTASAGPYQGLDGTTTQRFIDKALHLSGEQPSAATVEVYAAQVHLAALSDNLAAGREAVRQMWRLADRMPATAAGAGPAQRAASFNAYLEGRLGSIPDADKALRDADLSLRHLPLWHIEARLYHAYALARHGHYEQGLASAVEAARSLRYSSRVVRLAVDDMLRLLPPGYTSDMTDALRVHGTTGPKPWELITT